MPLVDLDRISVVAKAMNKTEIRPMNVFDPRFYPQSNTPLDQVIMYFLVMVAMDHRLSRPSKPYRAIVDGEELNGADLLYRLGKKRFDSEPDFFAPENLCKITARDIALWLTVGGATPPDPEVRAELLRDLGEKILKLFSGDPTLIIKIHGGYLRRVDGNGLLELLRVFKAYSDPVEKKSMLLIKFLSYRGLLNIVDKENIRLPVDNHLTRIALRLGLILLDKHLKEKVLLEVPVSHDEDVLIRYAVREAYGYLARNLDISPFLLDDFLWSFGRTVCTKGIPRCTSCKLNEVCLAYETGVFLNEPVYYDTWYY